MIQKDRELDEKMNELDEIDKEMNKIEMKINKENAPFLSQHLNPHEVCNTQIAYLIERLIEAKQEIIRLQGINNG